MPAVASPPVAQAAVCTGWSSATTPPPTIRVLRTGSGTVATVDFETYVKVVTAAEIPHGWPTEVLRAGAVAVKQYAWYYTMHWRGGSGTGGCYDVVDNSNDQVYSPETTTLYLSQIQAVESTWPESITRNGTFVFTGYRPGTSNVCGSDVDGARLYQKSARGCALAGMTGEQILQLYYGPGVVVQGAPDQSAATYHPLAPARVLDTVAGTGLTGPLTSHVARTFQVTGQGGVPAGATAVTGNLTVTGQTSLGYLFIGPVAMNDPASSNLNFPAGDTRANGVTVALGSGGTLSITYAASDLTATAGAIFDVTGYFTPDMTGATYFPLPPTRILDTRPTATGSNTPAVGNLIGPIGAQVAKTFQVTGQGGVPAGATAVTGNLTVTAQTSAGSLYLGPTAAAKPAIATLDFPVADNRADGVTMMLGSGGTLSFTLVAPAGQTAQVVFDVTGYFLPGTTAGDTYHSLTPTRLLDSRPTAKSGNPLNIGLSGPFHSHVARTFQVTGMWVPSNATAVTGNLTVTQQTSLGYLYIGPVAMNNPTSSSLNFPKSDNRANEVTVSLGSGGKLSVTYAASATTPTAQAIFDVAGYFTPAAPSQ